MILIGRITFFRQKIQKRKKKNATQQTNAKIMVLIHDFNV